MNHLLSFRFLVVFLKGQFLDLYSLLYTLHPLVKLLRSCLYSFISMLTILSYIFHFQALMLKTLLHGFLLHLTKCTLGSVSIDFLSTHLRLNTYSLELLSSAPRFLTRLYTFKIFLFVLVTLHVTLVWSLILILPLKSTSQLFVAHLSFTSGNCVKSDPLWTETLQ